MLIFGILFLIAVLSLAKLAGVGVPLFVFTLLFVLLIFLFGLAILWAVVRAFW